MEVVVFDVSLHVVTLHEGVVLLAAIARVGTHFLSKSAISVVEGIKEWFHRPRVVGIVEQGEVGDKLVLGTYLQVIARLGLPVVHCILLHAHKGGVRIGLAAGVALTQRLNMCVVF